MRHLAVFLVELKARGNLESWSEIAANRSFSVAAHPRLEECHIAAFSAFSQTPERALAHVDLSIVCVIHLKGFITLLQLHTSKSEQRSKMEDDREMRDGEAMIAENGDRRGFWT